MELKSKIQLSSLGYALSINKNASTVKAFNNFVIEHVNQFDPTDWETFASYVMLDLTASDMLEEIDFWRVMYSHLVRRSFIGVSIKTSVKLATLLMLCQYSNMHSLLKDVETNRGLE